VLGLGKYARMYKTWRKAKPVVDVLQKEGSMDKLKSRKLWLVAGMALLGSVMTQLGMEPAQWESTSEWLLKLAAVYIGGNAVEHVAGAVKAKKVG